MPANELTRLSIAEAGERIRRRALSPVELTRAYLDQIQARNADGRYYLTVLHDAGPGRRRGPPNRRSAAGHYRGPLHGIPVALKDLVMTRGIRTTCGSRILKDWVPETDATVAARLAAAGAVLLGKLNMHEFAYGPTGVNPHYGTPVQPLGRRSDARRVQQRLRRRGGRGALRRGAGNRHRRLDSHPGLALRHRRDSSRPTAGSAAPASSRWPGRWITSGPMTRTVTDAALLLQVLAGRDPADPSTAAVPVPDYRRGLERRSPRPPGRGRPRACSSSGWTRRSGPPSRPRRGRWRVSGSTWRRFAFLGSTTPGRRPSPSSRPSPWPITSRISRRAPSEYGADVRARLLTGQFVLATQYLKAQRARQVLRAEVDAVLAAGGRPPVPDHADSRASPGRAGGRGGRGDATTCAGG